MRSTDTGPPPLQQTADAYAQSPGSPWNNRESLSSSIAAPTPRRSNMKWYDPFIILGALLVGLGLLAAIVWML
jgi:hypothetical protein